MVELSAFLSRLRGPEDIFIERRNLPVESTQLEKQNRPKVFHVSAIERPNCQPKRFCKKNIEIKSGSAINEIIDFGYLVTFVGR